MKTRELEIIVYGLYNGIQNIWMSGPVSSITIGETIGEQDRT